MMEFDSLKEYISQVYRKELDERFLKMNAPGLTYVKLVRALDKCRISTVAMTADQLFFEAVRLEHSTTHMSSWLFVLADLHETIEGLIRLAGHPLANDEEYADAVNS